MTDRQITVSCAPVGLATIDNLPVDTLVLTPFSEDRPLRGAAGWCDWRLNGRLSRLIEREWFAPRRREVLLMDSAWSSGPARLAVFGLGSRAAMDLVSFRRAMERILQVVSRAGARSIALELPAVEPGPLSAPEAIRAFFEVLGGEPRLEAVTLLCPHRRLAEYAGEVGSDFPGLQVAEAGGWSRDRQSETGS